MLVRARAKEIRNKGGGSYEDDGSILGLDCDIGLDSATELSTFTESQCSIKNKHKKNRINSPLKNFS